MTKNSFNYKVAEVSDKMFTEFINSYKYAVMGTEDGKEYIIGFSNETIPNGIEKEFDNVRFAAYADVATKDRYVYVWLLNVRDAELPQLASKFKYTIIGWNDTEDDEGETIIGFTDAQEVHHKVIWDFDYYHSVDNVTGKVYQFNVKDC